MWDKVGITFKGYDRGKNAGLLVAATTFTDEQRKQLQAWMDEVYGVFKGHVTAARGDRLKKPIDEIAGGRVYTGQAGAGAGPGRQDRHAERRGAAHRASRRSWQRHVRRARDPRAEELPRSAAGRHVRANARGRRQARDRRGVLAIRDGGTGSITELALPYLQQLDPQRVQSVRAALRGWT